MATATIKEETFEAQVSKILNNKSEFKKVMVFANKKVGDNFKKVAGTKFGAYTAIISGNDMPLIEGLRVSFKCKLINKNGMLFYNCISWSYVKPENKASIKSYLNSTIGAMKLLSKKKIADLVEAFGNDTLEKFRLKDTNALLPYFCKTIVDTDGVEKMSEAINLVNASNENADFLKEMSELGINPTDAKKIVSTLGISSVEEIKKNPYLLAKVNGIGFGKCESIAIALKADMHSESRILCCTKYTLLKHLDSSGSMCMDANSLREAVLKNLFASTPNVKIEAHEWANAINKDKTSDEPIFFIYKKDNKTYIMLSDDNKNEANASKALHALNSVSSLQSRELVKALADRLNESEKDKRGFMLTPEQIDAVVNALTSKTAIITGGPGTGKTTITQMIIEMWKKLSTLPVTCMAPTGKAATRMSEQTGEEAHTIHKTVKIIPNEDGEGVQLKELEKGLTIVDESSMIDQETLTKMLSCVPVGSNLLFLGDIDQLPSVGRGDVLNQMIKSGKIATSRLTATKRQAEGSPIIENANKINHCESDLRWVQDQFELVKGSDNDIDKLKQIYLEKVKKYGLEQVAVLCPRRVSTSTKEKQGYKMCSSALNLVLRDVVNPKKSEDDLEIEVTTKDGKISFRVGDRVMSWKNKEEIANGDIGIITKIEEDEFHEFQFYIDWENGASTIHSRDDMKNVTLAYAMSIHKSQGSEYKCVIMPILLEQCGNKGFTKNLLYTGVTRAKQEVIIFGDKKAIELSCKNVQANNRQSFLALRLAK